ncbi:hypothetical protein LIER_05498 [Lithospermum erythrorhizon]|uniref:Late embryogenesis abundant protein LEA-2 subgroup domain-containing protein n=1 Tax=Lithospermum erythrorhizon TaxID=34254 RepID=A0AAV3P1M6_LITER
MADEPKQKDYDSDGDRDNRKTLVKAIFIILVLVCIVGVILWLVYKPHKPKFYVISASINNFNFNTNLNNLSFTMQFTLHTRNPNKRVTLLYDHLSVFLVYKNQVITPPLILPPLRQETKSTVGFSPVLGGGSVAASPEVVEGLRMDENFGVVGLRLVIMGRVRYKYKAGGIKSGHHGLYVRCDVLVGIKKGYTGQVPLLGSPVCKVDV